MKRRVLKLVLFLWVLATAPIFMPELVKAEDYFTFSDKDLPEGKVIKDDIDNTDSEDKGKSSDELQTNSDTVTVVVPYHDVEIKSGSKTEAAIKKLKNTSTPLKALIVVLLALISGMIVAVSRAVSWLRSKHSD